MKARLWAYPWDIIDEDPDAVMERVADAGFDEVSVAVLYHGGMLLLPHNPRRRVYFPEDGVVYFVPDSLRYQGSSLQPVVSELTRSSDVLAEICAAAASHGLTTVAWVVTLHNARFGLQYPELTLENAFGDRYPYALCPSQPQVGAFFQALVADLSRYPLGAVELEALYHQSYPHAWSHAKEGACRTWAHAHLLSLCFCPACVAQAAGQGVDGDEVSRHVRRALDDGLREGTVRGAAKDDVESVDELGSLVPGVAGYIAARTQAVTALLDRVCAASGVPVYGMIGSGLLGNEWRAGIALPDWAARCDGLTVNCYQRRWFGTVEEEAAEARRRINGPALYIGLQATWPQVNTASDLRRRIAEVRKVPADGVAIYNYGLMPSWHLEWAKSALREVADG
jgi:hypothetical protein